MSTRIEELQKHLALMEQFDRDLQKFSQWSESTLSGLHAASQISIGDLPAANTRVTVSDAAHVKRSQFETFWAWIQLVAIWRQGCHDFWLFFLFFLTENIQSNSAL